MNGDEGGNVRKDLRKRRHLMWAKKGNWGDNPSRNHMMNETLGVL